MGDIAFVCDECGSEWTSSFSGTLCPDCGNPLTDLRRAPDSLLASAGGPGSLLPHTSPTGGPPPTRKRRITRSPAFWSLLVLVVVIAVIAVVAATDKNATVPNSLNTASSGSTGATATGCQGTYRYSNGVVTATLSTQGPALVSFTTTADNPQIEVVSASVNLRAGQNGAVGTMNIRETPSQVTAVVVTENADGGPSGSSSSCTLTSQG